MKRQGEIDGVPGLEIGNAELGSIDSGFHKKAANLVFNEAIDVLLNLREVEKSARVEDTSESECMWSFFFGEEFVEHFCILLSWIDSFRFEVCGVAVDGGSFQERLGLICLKVGADPGEWPLVL